MGWLGRRLFWLAWPVRRLVLHNSKRSRVALIAEGKVLTVRHWIGPDEWSLPGGGIHAYETAEAAAVREIREELGIEVHADQLQFVGDGTVHGHGIKYTYALFTCRILKPEHLRLQRLEIAEVRWLPLGERPDCICTPDLQQALRMVQ